MPSVGKVVTITGTLTLGKIANCVESDDGGQVYLRSSNSDKLNETLRLLKKRLTVTGKLQHHDYVPPPKDANGFVSGVAPEHFYIDIGTATIIPAGAER